jgi:hypothetical protein
MTPQQRRSANARRLFHNNEARLLKMAHKPLRDDFGHHFRRIRLALAAVKPQCECEGVGQVLRIGGREAINGIVGRSKCYRWRWNKSRTLAWGPPRRKDFECRRTCVARVRARYSMARPSPASM